jgi:hypothetical protein
LRMLRRFNDMVFPLAVVSFSIGVQNKDACRPPCKPGLLCGRRYPPTSRLLSKGNIPRSKIDIAAKALRQERAPSALTTNAARTGEMLRRPPWHVNDDLI